MIGTGNKRSWQDELVRSEFARMPDMSASGEAEPGWAAKTLPWAPPQQTERPSVLELLSALLQGQDDRLKYRWGQDVPKGPRTMDLNAMGLGELPDDLVRQIGVAELMGMQRHRSGVK